MTTSRNIRGIGAGAVLALAAGLGIAACGTTTVTQPASSPVGQPGAVPTTGFPGLTPGAPLKVTTVSCGRYTAAQQAKFGTTAAAGYVAVIANGTAATVTQPQISVNFVLGSLVDTSNVSGDAASLRPGQSEQVAVDNLTPSGADGNPRDACQVTGTGYYSPAGHVSSTPSGAGA